MLTEPDAVRVLCFGDSNTHGAPGDDPEYVRLGPDVRWTGRLQRLLGDGYDVVEEGLNGRTTDVDYVDRPHCNGRTAFADVARPVRLSSRFRGPGRRRSRSPRRRRR